MADGPVVAPQPLTDAELEQLLTVRCCALWGDSALAALAELRTLRAERQHPMYEIGTAEDGLPYIRLVDQHAELSRLRERDRTLTELLTRARQTLKGIVEQYEVDCPDYWPGYIDTARDMAAALGGPDA